ncbi:MAG: ATP-binding protein [Prolixibacteraceae bacterium]|nr:ATP-binding protein [Prolixibacteraceae bacterium]MBN2650308.1 ATP-binding protein [Prolixibacteraceae bacterium]
MNNEQLKQIILDQKFVFNNKTKLIKRDIPLQKYINTQQVVVISGIRRCGKSSLLYLIKEEMNLSESEYCYFNFDDERIIANSDFPSAIFNLHITMYRKEPVLFLDEVQNIEGWEKFVNRMYEQGIKVFVTGSNARLLSSEISSSLTGRNKQLELFPFSFAEYLRFINSNYNINELSSKSEALLINDFEKYLQTGGFPLVVKENDIEIINAYFQDIVYRDIVARYRLSQVDEIKQIGLYLAANCGKLFSYATLQKISGVKSLSSIKNYLEYYAQSYLFFYLKKFDYTVKKQIMNSRKAYTIDPAFANRLGFAFSQNKGRLIENVVYIELLRRGKDIYYFSEKNECNFLIKEGLNITTAIQVCYQLNKNNEQREYNGLLEAMKTYKIKQGIMITAEKTYNTTHPGIDTMPIWKWLLSGNTANNNSSNGSMHS